MSTHRQPQPPEAPSPHPPSTRPAALLAACSGCERCWSLTFDDYMSGRKRCPSNCPPGTWVALVPAPPDCVVPPGPLGVILACSDCPRVWEPTYEQWDTGDTGCTCGGWAWVAELVTAPAGVAH